MFNINIRREGARPLPQTNTKHHETERDKPRSLQHDRPKKRYWRVPIRALAITSVGMGLDPIRKFTPNTRKRNGTSTARYAPSIMTTFPARPSFFRNGTSHVPYNNKIMAAFPMTRSPCREKITDKIFSWKNQPESLHG